MSILSIEHNIDDVLIKFEIMPEEMMDEIGQVLGEFGTVAMERTQAYISAPTPFYVRTGTYFRSWDITGPQRSVGGVEVVISSDAVDPSGKHYSRKVGGVDQAPIHVGRWRVLRDEIEVLVPDIISAIENAIARVARR
jgi:hypothetical protein